jgi:hypothetical protein
MLEEFKEEIWRQFGASLDMFENAIRQCPDSLWNDNENNYWYNVYHTLFFLDYYSTETPDGFSPPEPFTLSEFDTEGTMPERVYSKHELLNYLQYGREKTRLLISGLTSEKTKLRWINKWQNYSIVELILDNMRHVQHHVGQLNFLLDRIDHSLPIWVAQTKEVLNTKTN